MKHAGVVIFVAALSGCGGNAVCDPAVFCPARVDASYAFCNAGASGCYYVGSDGSKFSCRSCGDCASAQQLAIGWCASAPSNGETCQASTCGNGKSFQYCTNRDATQCRYVTSDGKEYKCIGCTNCTGAATQLQSWCGASANACSTKPAVQCIDCCRIANPAGEAYIRQNIWPCICNACSLDCAGSQYCGGTSAVTTACSNCLTNTAVQTCSPWINACMADAGCNAYYTCAQGCTGSP